MPLADLLFSPKKSAKVAYMEEVKSEVLNSAKHPEKVSKVSARRAQAKMIVKVEAIEISDSDDHHSRR